MKKTVAMLVLFTLWGIGLRAARASTSDVGTTQVTLGHSVVPLAGPWKFHIGDDATWANPSFDDGDWEVVDLGAKASSIDPAMGFEGFSPGWTGKGHPGYAGYAWYRMRIRVQGADEPLALLAPTDVDDSYQLFINGHLIGEFGSFAGSVPTIYYSRPVKYAIPADVLQQSRTERWRLRSGFIWLRALCCKLCLVACMRRRSSDMPMQLRPPTTWHGKSSFVPYQLSWRIGFCTSRSPF